MDEEGLNNVLTERSPVSDISLSLPSAASAVVVVPSSSVAPASVGSQGAQFYPEGGYGWTVLAATFVCTFW